jgi:3-methylcrotonyl-CoA carboxylase alpha subunit/geranyl-CoA carboxylase alpha subunit
MKRLLIANRGEIARRILRTAHAMGIETVAVYSDADAGALHVREATTAVALGGTASADRYLRGDKLLAAARATGADAVHPGYGFLSENADFAQAVTDAGLAWVGPPVSAIRQLGSKSAAKALARAHGVPVLPGYDGPDQSDGRLAQEAARIGVPLMVKAAAGGGGRGMRLVTDLAQLPAAVAGARNEAVAAFGSGELLLERALLNPRHVEVQVFADAHGRCIHLGERDCSVQRRHQKLVEESPSPAVDATLRARMGACAVALAQAAGYVGAGTVEFLLDEDATAGPEGRAFYLMEMNTRLQVEHPVTEALTGLDLVEWQIRTARGEPLPLAQDAVRWHGHAIEVRLCAEDELFRPQAGRVARFVPPPAAPGLRLDHALVDGGVVSPHYDSMLGKLIVHAPTRAEAIDRTVAALGELQLLGLPNNRAMLAAMVDHPVFRAGQATIPFLAQAADGLRETLAGAAARHRVAAALAVHHAPDRAPAAVLPAPFTRALRWRCGEGVTALDLRETGAGRFRVAVDGAEPVHGSIRPRQTGGWDVTLDGVTTAVVAAAVDSRWHVQAAGSDLWLENETFMPLSSANRSSGATDLKAPFNGKVVALAVQAGQAVRRGDTLVVLESMKLEHSLAAPRDAVVAAVTVAVGQQAGPGQMLVRFAE